MGLVDRISAWAGRTGDPTSGDAEDAVSLLAEAYDEIIRLRAALKPVAEAADHLDALASQEGIRAAEYKVVVPYEVLIEARAALAPAIDGATDGRR